MRKGLLTFITILFAGFVFGQGKKIENVKAGCLNWFNKDTKLDKIAGASVDKTYNSILVNMQPKKTVVVAVIDGGVDIHHEDLAGKIWVNEDEIPNNNIDDDANGYVDDVNGWNFVGNKSGKNVLYENYEYTRIVKQGNNKDFDKAKIQYDKEWTKRQTEKTNLASFEGVYNKAKSIILEKTGIAVKGKADLEKVQSKDADVTYAKNFLNKRYNMGLTDAALENYKQSNDEYFDFFLNKAYDARSIIGDNPLDLNDRSYGNNDVKGPRCDHGTFVAGIIAAERNNNIGINGIAANVKIMSLRTTPNGDERDKDVALAIIYAVDNGANILNMSFGKPFSPQKEFVDEAVRYAEAHGVLIVHSAGNSGENIDEVESFPCDYYMDKTKATNWINIGASEMKLNKKLPAVFSNYGKKHVDLFAPGVDIVSLDSDNTYNVHSGTSFSAPVVSGIAALLLSYYPNLTPKEIIDILMESSFKKYKSKKVLKPDLTTEKRSKTTFGELSESGGLVNAYEAMLLAKKKAE